MVNNTTLQRLLPETRVQVISNVPTGTGTTLLNLRMTGGTFAANGTSQVVITEPTVTANSAITITLKTVGGTVSPSVPYIDTITVGTGFTTKGTASDTSTYNYLVVG